METIPTAGIRERVGGTTVASNADRQLTERPRVSTESRRHTPRSIMPGSWCPLDDQRGDLAGAILREWIMRQIFACP